MLWGNGEAEEGRWRSRDMVICSSPPLRAGEPQVELSDYSSGLIFTDRCVCEFVCVCVCVRARARTFKPCTSIIMCHQANLLYCFIL